MRKVYGEQFEVRGPVIENERGRMVSDQPDTAWRRLPLPLEPVSVAAGATVTVSVQPQSIFKVVKLNLPAPRTPAGVVVQGIQITDIKVGQASQFIAGGAIDVLNFVPEAVSSYLDFDTGKVGNLFSVTFKNTTAETHVLAPMVICEVLRPGNSV